MVRLAGIAQYTVILYILIVGLASSFRGADVGTELATHKEKLASLEQWRVEIQLLKVPERLALIEASVGEIKWMLRSLIFVIVLEVARRLLRLVLNGKGSGG